MIKGKNAVRKLLSKPGLRYINSSKNPWKADNVNPDHQNENEIPEIRQKLKAGKRSKGSIMSIANLIRSSGKANFDYDISL